MRGSTWRRLCWLLPPDCWRAGCPPAAPRASNRSRHYARINDVMTKHTNDRLQGTLDLLVLKTLASRGRMHGYAITLHIEQISDSILRLEEGSLYPALHRMTQSGWLQAEWGASDNNRK